MVDFDHLPHTLSELNNALHGALIRAAVDLELERFVYVSSSLVYEQAELFPTPEDHLYSCPPPVSAYGFSKLTGEVYCRAANEEHGLPYTICRPFSPYGPSDPADRQPGTALAVRELIGQVLAGRRPLEIFGSSEQTRTLTHLDDIADGIVVAMGSRAALNEDFNISASRELTVAEIARTIWDACGADPDAFAAEYLPGFAGDVKRRWPSVEKAGSLLGWGARIEVEEGLAATVRLMRGQRDGAGIAASAVSPLSGAPLS
jgi:nucleoside-diphosphate-sugar epimerase